LGAGKRTVPNGLLAERKERGRIVRTTKSGGQGAVQRAKGVILLPKKQQQTGKGGS